MEKGSLRYEVNLPSRIGCRCGYRCIVLVASLAVVQKEEDSRNLSGQWMQDLFKSVVRKHDLT